MRNDIKLMIIILLITLSAFTVQHNFIDLADKKFTVYLQENRYDNTVGSIVSNFSNFKYYKYLGIYYIDRDNKGIIDYKYVDQGIDKLYPQKNDSGFLCLNLENRIYQNLKKYKAGQVQFDTSEKQLIDFIRYVKAKLPNVKVGMYGLPSNFYWVNNDKENPNKFDNLLSEVDYISPQLYIYYSKNQYGIQGNINYIKQNLDQSLGYGQRLKKPVIPYVWYLVHPSNKKFGNELIPQEEMTVYLKTISSYEFANQSAQGMIWWEPAKLDYKVPISFKSKIKSNYTINSIAIQYLGFLGDNKK